jgi:HK97 family phage major capsid protein
MTPGVRAFFLFGVKGQQRLMTRDIRHARQDRADLEATEKALKAEGRKLLILESRNSTQDTRLKAIDNELCSVATRQAEVAQELAHFERMRDEEIANGGSYSGALAAPGQVVRASGRTYREMFPGVALNMGGFQSSEEFLATIHSGLADPRLMATNTGTVPSEGGFSVPTQVFAQWLDASLEGEIVRKRADVRPMTSSDAVAPGWDDGDHSSTLYGGFTGAWVPEAGDMTVETPKLRLISLKARKLAILTRASNELIADGMGFEQQLGTAIVKALGWFLDRAFLTGNGAAAPQGILNSGATISVAKETGQAAATIVYENIAKMFARLAPASMANAVWVCNSTAIPQLLQLSMTIGTGGSHIPVLSENGGTWRMLTLPVVFTEKVPALGTVGDIMLADFSQYVVGVRADFSLTKSVHAGFTSDTSYYRGIIRVDGQPKRSAPMTPDNGNTVSPFVVLATRS